jgi:2-dehydro-3-deoxygalactonokinase
VVRLGNRYLAVDWGTTNRRVFVIEDGQVTHSERDDHGVTAVAPGGFEAEVAGLRARFGEMPMLLAGMIGSNVGWRAVPYVAAPAGLAALAANLAWIDSATAIVPGLSLIDRGRADVMRGEEVQLLGAVAAGLTPADALLCQPGTHCKWAEMAGGEVSRFTTSMTGELFALLRTYGLLAAQLGYEVIPGDAFRAGVTEGKRRDLGASLFGIRPAGLLGLRADADAASFASGVLIGSDVAARLAESGSDTVHVLADPGLGTLYTVAIEAQGRSARLVDSHAAFAAGIIALGKLIA